MAIGQIRLGNTARSTSRVRASSQSFGAGVSSALGTLAEVTEDIEDSQHAIELAQLDRQEKREAFDARISYTDYITQQTIAQGDRQRGTTSPDNYTNDTRVEIEERNAAFIAGLPASQQEWAAEKLANFSQDQAFKAYNFQVKMENENDRAELTRVMNRAQNDIYSGKIGVEEALAAADELIEHTGLGQLEKDALRVEIQQGFNKAQYQNAVQTALNTQQSFSTLSPAELAFLNTVTAREGAGKWNVIHGGGTFESFDNHPNQKVVIKSGPNKGDVTTAAGAFQITFPTWQFIQKNIGTPLPDFSPDSQVKAAMWLAEYRYNKKMPLGATFDEVLHSGDAAAILSIRDALAPTWVAFEGFTDKDFLTMMQNPDASKFANAPPSLWDDPQYEDISLEDKQRLAAATRAEVKARDTATRREFYDNMLSGVNAGIISRDAIDNAEITKQITAENAQTLNKRFETVHKEALAMQRAVEKVMNPNTVWRERPEDHDDLDMLFEPEGRQALLNMDKDYVTAALVPLVAKAKVVPPAAAKMLQQMLNGENGEQVNFALATAAELMRVAPASMKKAMGDSVNLIDYYRHAGEFLTPDELSQRMQWVRDPAFKQQRDILATESVESFSKKSVTDIYKEFDSSWGAFFQGDASLAPTVEFTLMRDAGRLYETNFVLAKGDSSTAWDMTMDQLGRVYGATDVGGSVRFGKYMPESYPNFFPPDMDDGLEWMDLQVRQELGLEDDTEFQLVSDKQTKAEVDQGTAPSYIIFYKDEDGRSQPALATDRFALDLNGAISTENTLQLYRYKGDRDFDEERRLALPEIERREEQRLRYAPDYPGLPPTRELRKIN